MLKILQGKDIQPRIKYDPKLISGINILVPFYFYKADFGYWVLLYEGVLFLWNFPNRTSQLTQLAFEIHYPDYITLSNAKSCLESRGGDGCVSASSDLDSSFFREKLE